MRYIREAAALAGLKPAAYAARVALAVAKGDLIPLPVDEKDRLRALSEARVAVDRIGSDLSQVVEVLNAEGEEPAEQVAAVLERVARTVRSLDDATIAFMARRG
ncbi:hypothetical protein [Streptomyces triculaminicus]|uniref:hypothetical protein n=1 Tax=Streptomyces triculaminicus TaxID=2816232 RepID=UPI0037B8BC1C